MIKKTFLIFLLFSLIHNLNAQKLQIGLSIDPTMTLVRTDSKDFYSIKASQSYNPMNYGFAAGVSLKYGTGKRWFFQTGFLLGTRNYTSVMVGTLGSNLFNPVSFKYVYKTTSLDIPINMNYLILTNSIQPYISIGMGLRTYLSKTADATVENHINHFRYVDNLNSPDLYLNLGIGCNFIFKKNNTLQTQFVCSPFILSKENYTSSDQFTDFTLIVSYFRTVKF